MGRGKNIFGGGNPNSLYTPMSEDEQEVISRLVASGSLSVHLLGWGIVNSPKAQFGDMRIDIPIQITFDSPTPPILVDYFDMELRTNSGILLFKERQSCKYGGQPIAVGAGTTLSMVWHIAIRSMDPKIVKAIKPGAMGLTSRFLDKDTGEATLIGNTKLSAKGRALLLKLRRSEERLKARTNR